MDGVVVIHEIRQVIDHIDAAIDPASEPLGDRDSALLLHAAGQRHDAVTHHDVHRSREIQEEIRGCCVARSRSSRDR
jgi:hypothetical protein